MNSLTDDNIIFTRDDSIRLIIITLTRKNKKYNTCVSGWDVDLLILKEYLATIKKNKGCNGWIKKAIVFKQGNDDDQSDNDDDQSDNDDDQSDNENDQSDNNYKKINKKEPNKYVLHFQGNHVDYIKEFIASTGIEEYLIRIC